ncbi:Oleosin 18.5 kDa [Capsicum baccatum]|uniref:Oleosin 18.5 kDa n=1 Tax=Capsicum baccatum TaxID=33114 RepID=A0A2G2WTY0_CAPBA|nr:Oleosin 18.5 kDa [Capsicum baccatum]
MGQIQPAARHEEHKQLSRQVAKTTTVVTVGRSLMVLSGLTLVATVIVLLVATPLLVVFSLVLVPAAITVFMILGGLLAALGFCCDMHIFS